MSAYSAAIFNDWVKLAERWWPVEGMNCQLRMTRTGTVVSYTGRDEPEHDWQVSCVPQPRQDDPTKIEWRAFVRPGLVNGHDATIKEDRLDASTGKTVATDVPLTDETAPSLALRSWRNPLAPAGFTTSLDGDLLALPAEGYPAFFDNLGVKLPAKGGNINGLGALAAEPDENRTREIRAMDIFLAVPRLATRNNVEIRDPLTDAQSVVITTVFVNDFVRNSSNPYRLQATSKWTAPREPDYLERLMGTAVEPQTDELKMSTVWMLSPPGAAQDAVPDETWTPYVQHFVFYNLMYASRNQPPKDPAPPLRLVTGLVFGVGDALFNALLSPVNDYFNLIDALFGAANFKGSFWTT